MKLNTLESNLLQDIRMRDQFIAKGIITEKDLAKELSALPDLAGEADEIAVYEEPTEAMHATFEPA